MIIDYEFTMTLNINYSTPSDWSPGKKLLSTLLVIICFGIWGISSIWDTSTYVLINGWMIDFNFIGLYRKPTKNCDTFQIELTFQFDVINAWRFLKIVITFLSYLFVNLSRSTLVQLYGIKFWVITLSFL